MGPGIGVFRANRQVEDPNLLLVVERADCFFDHLVHQRLGRKSGGSREPRMGLQHPSGMDWSSALKEMPVPQGHLEVAIARQASDESAVWANLLPGVTRWKERSLPISPARRGWPDAIPSSRMPTGSPSASISKVRSSKLVCIQSDGSKKGVGGVVTLSTTDSANMASTALRESRPRSTVNCWRAWLPAPLPPPERERFE